MERLTEVKTEIANIFIEGLNKGNFRDTHQRLLALTIEKSLLKLNTLKNDYGSKVYIYDVQDIQEDLLACVRYCNSLVFSTVGEMKS